MIPDGLVLGAGVAEWVADQTGATGHHQPVGIGWARGGEIVAGCMFVNYSGASIDAHIAVRPGTMMAKTWVAAIIDYPFKQVKVRRVTCLIDERNTACRGFVEHLGARCEGLLKDALPDGNLMVYGFLKYDAQKWLTASFQRLLTGDGNGQEKQPAASA